MSLRWIAALLAAAAVAAAALASGADPRVVRAAAVAGICLALWLSEAVPPYVPTLLLWVLTPLLLGPLGEDFRLSQVLGWAADPVLALFLGGFALSAAAGRYGIDAWIARVAVRLSGGRRLALLALTAGATAVLSMWMSNIAAAAMMIAALRPLLADAAPGDPFRRALLLGVAAGANFGGMATPIGTGPNAIAIAAITEGGTPVTFLSWMTFALPLAVGLVLAALLFLVLRFRVRGSSGLPEVPREPLTGGGRAVVGLFLLAVAAWLTEPAHGVPAAVVALAVTAFLFGSRLLDREDLGRLDWATLILIAGGISLGALLDRSGAVQAAAAAVPWEAAPPFLRLLALCLASAALSALMSNTATATLLIPLAATLDPNPSTAVLIAIAASLGVPFAISTPPNAMVYGEGGIRQTDLAVPGLVLMILGCVLISATGTAVLALAGIL